MASAQRARSPYRAALQAPILPATPGPGVVLESWSRAAMAPLLGAECERRGVAWADGGEVAAVEGGDLGDGEAFGQGDDGGVDGAEREVGVGGDEVTARSRSGDVGSVSWKSPAARERRNSASSRGPDSRASR